MNNEIEYFDTDDYLADVLPQVAESKFTHFPVVDGDNLVIGVLSRRHLLNYQKKNVVLIDHNELAQTVNGIKYYQSIELLGDYYLATAIPTTTGLPGFSESLIVSVPSSP